MYLHQQDDSQRSWKLGILQSVSLKNLRKLGEALKYLQQMKSIWESGLQKMENKSSKFLTQIYQAVQLIHPFPEAEVSSEMVSLEGQLTKVAIFRYLKSLARGLIEWWIQRRRPGKTYNSGCLKPSVKHGGGSVSQMEIFQNWWNYKLRKSHFDPSYNTIWKQSDWDWLCSSEITMITNMLPKKSKHRWIKNMQWSHQTASPEPAPQHYWSSVASSW